MRIGIVSPYSLTSPGGVQGQVLGLARALRLRGHEVRVLGPCDGFPPETGITALGRSTLLETNGSIAPIAPDAAAQLRTIRALWAEEFDVTHIHEPLVPGPAATTMLMKISPLVATFHASGDFSSFQSIGRLLRWGIGHLDVKAAVSLDARSTAGAWMDEECPVLFNGVEVERFAEAEPWPGGERAVMFVGRHEDRKGLGVLLAASEHMGDDVRLWIAGTGPLTDELKGRYGNDARIEWLGRLTDEERDRRLAGAAVFCAPALGGESFGVVLAEAMAARTPVVASHIAGYTNVAEHEHNALLFEPGNPAELAAALDRVLNDRELADRLVAAGVERADEFSMTRLAEIYELLYETAMSRHKLATGR